MPRFLPQPITLSSSNPFPSPHGRVMRDPWEPSVNAEFYTNFMSYSQLRLSLPIISNILLAGEMGNPIDQALLFKVVQEKEPPIAAHLQTRRLAIQACDWSILPKKNAKNQEKANYKAAIMTDILQEAGLDDFKAHLTGAVGDGYAGGLIDWAAGGSKINGFHQADQANWAFSRNANVACRDALGRLIVIDEDNCHQFVLHKYQMKSGIPSTGGLLRVLLWTYFFKHRGEMQQARFLEKYGIPFIIAKIRQEDYIDPEIREGIQRGLADVGSDGVAVVTEGTEIQIANPPTTSANSSFTNWFKYLDDHYAILILGQKASMSEGGGMNNGQIQDNVRRDILKGDCRGLKATIQNQIIRPLEYFKWGTNDCMFDIVDESTEAQKDKATVIQMAANANYKPTPESVAQALKMPIQGAADPMSENAQQSVAVPLPPTAPVTSPQRSNKQPQASPQAMAPAPKAPSGEVQPEGQEEAEASALGVPMVDNKGAVRVKRLAMADGDPTDDFTNSVMSNLPATQEGQPANGQSPFSASSPEAAAEAQPPQAPSAPVEPTEQPAQPQVEVQAPAQPTEPSTQPTQPQATPQPPAQPEAVPQASDEDLRKSLNTFSTKAAKGQDGATYEEWKASLPEDVQSQVNDDFMKVHYANTVNHKRILDVEQDLAQADNQAKRGEPVDPSFFDDTHKKMLAVHDNMLNDLTWQKLSKEDKQAFLVQETQLAQQLSDAKESRQNTESGVGAMGALTDGWRAFERHFATSIPEAIGGVAQALGAKEWGTDVVNGAEARKQEAGLSESYEAQKGGWNFNNVAIALGEGAAGLTELVVGTRLGSLALKGVATLAKIEDVAAASRAATVAEMGSEAETAAKAVSSDLANGIRAWEKTGETAGWVLPAFTESFGQTYSSSFKTIRQQEYDNNKLQGMSEADAAVAADITADRKAWGESLAKGAVAIAGAKLAFEGLGKGLIESLGPKASEAVTQTVGDVVSASWNKYVNAAVVGVIQAGKGGALQSVTTSIANDIVDGLHGDSRIFNIVSKAVGQGVFQSMAKDDVRAFKDNLLSAVIGALPFALAGVTSPALPAVREFREGLKDLYRAPEIDHSKFEQAPVDVSHHAVVEDVLKTHAVANLSDALKAQSEAMNDVTDFKVRIVDPKNETARVCNSL